MKVKILVLVLFASVAEGGWFSAFANDEEAWLNRWNRVQEIRMEKMKEALQIDEITMNQLAPSLRLLAQKKREIGKERLSLLKALKMITENKENEATLETTLQRLEANGIALQTVRQEEMAQIKAHLTPAQQAKLILFQQQFKKEVRDIVQREKEKE